MPCAPTIAHPHPSVNSGQALTSPVKGEVAHSAWIPASAGMTYKGRPDGSPLQYWAQSFVSALSGLLL